MSKEYIKVNSGSCAVCDSTNIDYGNTEIDNQQIGYEYQCLDCKNDGIEWYAMEYIETVSLGKE